MPLWLSPFYKDMGPIELSTPTSKVTFGGSKEVCESWKGTTQPRAGASASALTPSNVWKLPSSGSSRHLVCKLRLDL